MLVAEFWHQLIVRRLAPPRRHLFLLPLVVLSFWTQQDVAHRCRQRAFSSTIQCRFSIMVLSTRATMLVLLATYSVFLPRARLTVAAVWTLHNLASICHMSLQVKDLTQRAQRPQEIIYRRMFHCLHHQPWRQTPSRIINQCILHNNSTLRKVFQPLAYRARLGMGLSSPRLPFTLKDIRSLPLVKARVSKLLSERPSCKTTKSARLKLSMCTTLGPCSSDTFFSLLYVCGLWSLFCLFTLASPSVPVPALILTPPHLISDLSRDVG